MNVPTAGQKRGAPGPKGASLHLIPHPRAIELAVDKEFAPFRLDTTNQCLWRRKDSGEEERILLRPKSYAVLRYLVERAGRLVTEDELLDALWPEVSVEPQAVKGSTFDVRRALGDSAKKPVRSRLFPNAGTVSPRSREMAQTSVPRVRCG